MPDAPNIPGPKKPADKKKILIVGGIAVVGGAIGIIFLRNRQSSNAAGSNQAGIDPNTGVPYSQEAIDPSTGVPYADEASYAGGIGTTPGALGTYNPLTGAYTPGLGTTPVVTSPASNATWEQAAIAQLENLGFDPVAAATAIGLYLQGAPLTADQYQAVAAALGLEGNPPQGAPPIVQTGGGGTGNSGNGSTGNGITNPVIGPTKVPFQISSGLAHWLHDLSPAQRIKLGTVQQHTIPGISQVQAQLNLLTPAELHTLGDTSIAHIPIGASTRA